MGIGSLIGGGLSAGGSIIGGKNSSDAATQAANIQANAANNAALLQAEAFNYTSGKLAPYVDIGTYGTEGGAIGKYEAGLNNLYTDQYGLLYPALNKITGMRPFTATPTTTSATIPASFDYQNWGLGADQQAALEKTPGYQFTKEQGLNAVQNSAAAQGRGVSGNALTAAGKYATGLADTTYNQQLKNAMTGQGLAFGQTLQGQGQAANQANQYYGTYQSSVLAPEAQEFAQGSNIIYNPLAELRSGIGIGENAAARVGNAGQSAANAAGNQLTSGAAASAAGVIGANNALIGGYTGAGNSISNALLMNNLFDGGGSLGSLFGGGNSSYYGPSTWGLDYGGGY